MKANMILKALIGASAMLIALVAGCASNDKALAPSNPAPESVSPIEAPSAAPSVESVLERYIEATGGRARSEAVHAIITRGWAEISGLLCAIEVIQEAPNKSLTRISIPGMGDILQCSDGEIAWLDSAVTGPILFEGEELEAMKAISAFDYHLDPASYGFSASYAGLEHVEGKPCHALRFEGPGGIVIIDYFDASSGLLVKKTSTQKGMGGETTSSILISDYREVEGLLMAFKQIQEGGGQSMAVSLEEVLINPEIAPDAFAPTSAVAGLL
jgi:hypothetical protein